MIDTSGLVVESSALEGWCATMEGTDLCSGRAAASTDIGETDADGWPVSVPAAERVRSILMSPNGPTKLAANKLLRDPR